MFYCALCKSAEMSCAAAFSAFSEFPEAEFVAAFSESEFCAFCVCAAVLLVVWAGLGAFLPNVSRIVSVSDFCLDFKKSVLVLSR